MIDIFISYVEEDADVVEPLARALIEAGYSCWYYQRSSLPGASYLQQISDALFQAKIVLLVLSPQTLDSFQVDKEISFAHECNKPFLPITRDIAWGDFQQRRPTWRLAVGTSVAIAISPDGVAAVLPKVIEGLQGLRVLPAAPAEHSAQPVAGEPGVVDQAPTVGGAPSSRELRSDAPSAPLVAPGLVTSVAAPGSLPTRTALVGRTAELDYLKAQYDLAASGQGGRLVFIGGEPGVGKTRLAQDAGLHAWSRGGVLLQGTYQRDGTTPYGAWVDALRPALRASSSSALAGIAGVYRYELSQLFPELVEQLEPVVAPPAVSPEEQRRRLLDSLAELLIRLSKRTPLVLVLNDLQWAPGLAPLVHLSGRLAEMRALVLGTYRDQELKEQPRLLQEWSALHQSRVAAQLSLRPLADFDTEQLIAQYLGAEPARQLAELLYHRTRGNPFFVEEVLRSLVESGAIRATPNGWEIGDASGWRVPESVQLVVRARVDRLGAEAREVLTQAAVLGQEFSFAALQALSGRSEDEVLRVVEAALTAQLLVDRSLATEERYAFADDQVQEALAASLMAPRRRRAHLRAGQVLEALYADRIDRHVEELAHHFLQGNDPEKAYRYALAAGDRAYRLASWPRAEEYFQTALALLAELPEAPERKLPVVERLANLDWVLARPGLGHIKEALESYERLGDRRRAARMHDFVGTRWSSGTAGRADMREAMAHYEAAATLMATESDCPEKASAHSFFAHSLTLGRFDLPAALEQGCRGLAIAERLGDPSQIAYACTFLGAAKAHGGALAEAEQLVERGYEASLRGQDAYAHYAQAVAVTFPIAWWPWRNDRAWTSRWLRRHVEYQERSQVERFYRITYGVSALEAALSGRPVEAREALRREDDLAARHASYWTFFLYYAGAANHILGSPEGASRLLSLAYQVSVDGSFKPIQTQAAYRYGCLLLERGDLDQAESVLLGSHAVADQRAPAHELLLLPALIELHIRAGRLPETERALKRAESILSAAEPWGGLAAGVHRARGLLAAVAKRWSEAEGAFAAALETEQATGFRFHEALHLSAWAELYLQRDQPGDRERGLEKLGQALAIFEQCAAKKDVERVLARRAAVG